MKVDEFIAGRGHKQKRPEIESSDSAVSGRVSKGEKKEVCGRRGNWRMWVGHGTQGKE